MSASQPERGPSGVWKSEEQLKKEFSARLRRLREARSQTQSQVAKALGFLSESVYQLWEKENGNLPSAFNLQKLALHFKVSTDYLLGLQEEQQTAASVGEAQGESEEERHKLEVFRLGMQGKNWNAPEVDAHLRFLHRLRETPQERYDRVLTDVTYPPHNTHLPRLNDFYTPVATRKKEEIEALFRDRPADQARRVRMYVLDLGQVPSPRLQRIILGMQGAELIKGRHDHFTLAMSNGSMARDVILAPNLARGDIEDVKLIPLTLGRSQSDATAATTLIGNFVFNHGDYRVERVSLKDEKGPQRIAMLAGSINLAFMGIGSLESEDSMSLYARLLSEQGIDPAELRREGVIGNVLFHFIRETPGPSWEIYDPPGDPPKRIRVDISDREEEDILHTMSLHVLHELVEIQEAQIVVVVKDPSRARIVRAALEMHWANAVICSLAVAEKLSELLRTEPIK
ncbi:MAG TPA: helix-turn-helix transcriptional regulator [Ktedonobacterales bacterium]|nr:helix-turn-helix transcriptional regulator [Ktedonobacterales bacterium]